jgi:hypothetical protein
MDTNDAPREQDGLIGVRESVTWTPYPSLLQALEVNEDRITLEQIAFAHYSGRYQEATELYQAWDATPSAKTIFVLQMADMFTSQGLEHDRIQLLESALLYSSEGTDPTSQLMRLMLANAEFWAYGKTTWLLDMVYRVKASLRSKDSADLTDIEVLPALFARHIG